MALKSKMTRCEVKRSREIGRSTHFLDSNYLSPFKDRKWSIIIWKKEFLIERVLQHKNTFPNEGSPFPNAFKHSKQDCVFRGFQSWPTWVREFTGQPFKALSRILMTLWLSDHALTASATSYSHFPSTLLRRNHFGPSLETYFPTVLQSFCRNSAAMSPLDTVLPAVGLEAKFPFPRTPSWKWSPH